MWRPEYYVRLVALPPQIEGVSIPNNDGSFDIYINNVLSPSRRDKTLRHELNHIIDDHFYRDDLTVGEIESAAEAGRLLGLPSRKAAVQSENRSFIREFASLEALLVFALKHGGL